ALEPAVQRERCQVRVLPAATQEEIAAIFQDEFYEGRIWIFHYGGHADEDELWLETEASGNRSFFSLGLSRFLGAQKGLKLVFLNGCATGEHAQLMLDAGVPSVIATSRKIDDEQARDFSVSFYQGLAAGSSLEEAFQESEGMLLGRFGPQAFGAESGTRSLFWEEETGGESVATKNQALDVPWRLFLREDANWVPAQWRLFYALSPAEEQERPLAQAFVGETIGNYRLEELLGEGTMGAVFRAVHTELNEERAIKVTHPVLEGYDHLKRIIIAGHKGLAAIKHPNVAQFFDVGEVVLFGQKRLYIVMELVKGTRLDKLDAHTYLTTQDDLQRLTDLAIQIAAGLEAAHKTQFVDETGMAREGIVHGNILPRKILFTPEGVPKLIDFLFTDLTRARNIRLDLPPSVQQKARAERPDAYLAPELIEGQTNVNKGTDIYALGMVFYGFVSGSDLQTDPIPRDVNLLHQRLRTRSRHFPRNLSKAIFQATHPDPKTRYQSVGQMIDDMLVKSSLFKRLWVWWRRK
ncbi:MAG: CHAT domain-containing protein, partial [Bacteroidetes bacterium]